MQRLIKSLQTKQLIAGCPKCGGEFALADTLLFDGTVDFPEEAEQRRREYETDLKQQIAELKVRQHRAEVTAAVTTRAVRIGQMIEHIVPSFEQFHFKPTDCRALFDPIDMIVFDGLSKGRVESLTFMEIKTGGGRLNRHQRLIRDTIKAGRVDYEEV